MIACSCPAGLVYNIDSSQWECSQCGTSHGNAGIDMSNLELSDWAASSPAWTGTKVVEIKCDCGGEIVYGKDCTPHSNWCSIKKRG